MVGLRDRNRFRKTYSFFRARPSLERCVTTGADVLNFENLTQLELQDVTDLESGELVYVKTLRDFFVLEKTVNSGSVNSIDTITASGFGGVWYRLNMGGEYWKHQYTWYINSSTGDDENLGSNDAPLATHDEFVRRLLFTNKVTYDYTVYFQEGTVLSGGFVPDIELDGGSLTYVGTAVTGSSLGTATYLKQELDYTNSQLPMVQASSLTGNEDVLFIDNEFLGWVVKKPTSAPGVYTTEQRSGSLTETITSASISLWAPLAMSVRGQGLVTIQDFVLGINDFVISPGSQINVVRSKIVPNTNLNVYGGTLFFDHCHVSASSFNVTIQDSSLFISSGSAFSSNSGSITVKQGSLFEVGSTSIFNSLVDVQSSKVIMSLQGSSGSALVDSSISARTNSTIDLRSTFKSGSGEQNPVRLYGSSVEVLFNSSSVPKLDNIYIEDSLLTTYLWSQMPYNDFLRNVRIISGSTLVNA